MSLQEAPMTSPHQLAFSLPKNNFIIFLVSS